MSHLTLLLLGTFQVLLDGRPVSRFGYDKVRALLAYLVMSSGLALRREALAGLLWPDQPARAARHSLSQAVLTLRRALEDRAARPPFILTDRDTLQFNPRSSFQVDALDFAAHLEAASAHPHLALEDCPACIRRLEAAVALYRGEFLHGLLVGDSMDFEEWVVSWRERLHMQAVSALHGLARHYAFRGKYRQAQQFARRQVELEPYREEAHRQLMRILARSGQRSAALAQYRACAEILSAELGVEPDRETRALYHRIRSAREHSPHNLPARRAAFIGRQRELMRLAEYLAHPDYRLVTITGIGGVGKTRLALEAAREHIGIYPDGLYFVPLSGVSRPEYLPATIADAAGAPLSGRKPPREELAAFLQDKELLLVLDNFEHLLDGAPLIAFLLQRAPHVDILVTSIDALDIQGETRLHLDGLPYPEAEDETLPPVEWPAVKLFVTRARQQRPDFALTDENAAHVVRICRLTHGNPLVIEMAAAWVSLYDCERIAREIAADLASLASRRRDLPPRQSSVRAVFEYAWALLSAEERRIARQLSVFRGGFSPQAVQEMVGAPCADVLQSLARKSFLHQDAGGRLFLHPTLRHFLAEMLAAEPEVQEAAQRAHAACYTALLRRRRDSLRERQEQSVLNALDLERENLRAAWEWAVSRRAWGMLDDALEALYIFYWARNHFQEGQAAFAQAIAALEQEAQTRPVLMARLQAARAEFTAWLGDLPRAQQELQASLAVLREQGAEKSFGDTLLSLAVCFYWQGRYAPAQAHCEEALALARRVHDIPLTARALVTLASILCEQSEAHYDAALPLYAEGLTLYRRLGDRHGEANVLLNLGAVWYEKMQYERAWELYSESLALYRQMRYPRGIAAALNNLAMIARRQGNLSKARALIAESLEIKRQTGNRVAMLYSLLELGGVYAALGQVRQAYQAFVEMLTVAEKTQSRDMCWQAVLGIADLAVQHGAAEQAAGWVAFVRARPSLSQSTASIAAEMEAKMQAVLPAEALARAEQRAETLTRAAILQEAVSLNLHMGA